MFDVFFISYHEQYADENFEALKDKVPIAKRVDGIKGIFNAHKRAAELSKTKMFYVVDADALLVEDFEFDYQLTEFDKTYRNVLKTNCVHTWRALNPINDLVYGYGGVKLFPTKGLKNATKWNVDFTTSVVKHFIPMPEVSNITAFNTDPFNTWKSGFRECVKLSSSVIKNQHPDTEKRLDIWCTIGDDRLYGKDAIAGAIAGRKYGIQHKGDIDALSKINDYDWLKEQYAIT